MKTCICLLLVIVFALALFSCQNISIVRTEASLTPSAAPSKTLPTKYVEEVVSSTLIPTPVQLSSTPNPYPAIIAPTHSSTPEPTPTATLQFEPQTKCIQIVPALETRPNGKLIVQDFYDTALLDLTSEIRSILSSSGATPVISPSGEQIAFIDRKTQRLRIVNYNEEVVASHTVPENWWKVIAWVSDDELIIEEFLGRTETPLAASVLYTLQTEMVTKLPYHWPDIYTFGVVRGWNHSGMTAAVFNNQLSYVVYLAEFPLVLYDLSTSREITRADGVGSWYANEPQWAKDGQSFLTSLTPYGTWWEPLSADESPDGLPYMGGTDMFRVSINGDKERLTYISAGTHASQDAATVSPKENYVAFWHNEQPDIGYGIPVTRTLTLLDLHTNIVTDVCLESNTYTTYGTDNKSGTVYSPVWSPDERYLAIFTQFSSPQNTQILIIDLETFTGMYLPSEAVPVGWLLELE